MINVDNSNRKGIYKDLYRTLETEKHKQKNEAFAARAPRGIYKDIYKGIEKAQAKNDIWHKYPLKILVYSNDFGEAVRPIIGGALAKLSWIPAIFYTIFALKSKEDKKNIRKEITFQAVASFILPFLLLKSSRKAMHKAIDHIPASFKENIKAKTAKISILDKLINKFKKNNSSGYRNFALSVGGIGTIAIGAKPIDNMVKSCMDNHLAKEV